MSDPIFFLTVGGNGYSPDGTLPEGAVECTQEQYANAAAWTIKSGKVVASTPSLAAAQDMQAQAAKIACGAAIAGGFSSSGSGQLCAYPSDDASQRNTTMAAVSGGSLWCETASVWALVKHTASQAQQVQADMFAMIQKNQDKYAKLLASISAATTVEAVQAFSW